MTAHRVDGTDMEACLETLGNAVAQARTGKGPQLVVAQLLRLCGHGEHDDASYIDPKLKQSPLGRDCLKVAEAAILHHHWADPATLETLRREAEQQVEDAVARVQQEPTPDPYKEDWCALASKHLVDGYLE